VKGSSRRFRRWLISTATGIIVTRAAAESSFGQDLSRQLIQEPRALAIAAGLLVLFGFFGLPPIFMFIMARSSPHYTSAKRRVKSRALVLATARLECRGNRCRGQSNAPVVKPAESVVPLLSYESDGTPRSASA